MAAGLTLSIQNIGAPMQIIIHVGSPKTGSSSLQEYLYSHREKLKEVGVLYPDFGYRAHTQLSAAFVNRDKPGQRLARRLELNQERGKQTVPLDEFKRQLRELIANFDDKLLILSNEGLSHKPRAGNLLNFVKEARPDAEVFVLDYIRSPISHFPSATQQNLKAQGYEVLFPAHWISTHCIRGRYLLDEMPENVTLRVFSPDMLVNGDLIDDFNDFVKKRTGIDMPENTDTSPRNASFSVPASGLLALRDIVTDKPFPMEDRGSLLQQLRVADQALTPEKLKLPDDFRDAITANNHEAWNGLIDETEYDAATRERLKLPAAQMPADIEKMNSILWLATGVTKDYVMEYLRNLRADRNKRAVKRITRWVVHAVNSTTHLHNVEITRKDVGALKANDGATPDAWEKAEAKFAGEAPLESAL